MEPGSALFTLGTTYHGAGENECEAGDPDALRTLFAVFAQRDYFRQDPEEVLSTPIEVKAVGGVGYVEDHQSPVEFLFKDDTGIGAYGSTRGNLAL
ncbi:hypothetical protein CLAFUW4_03761 [Fulvia fulva]|uniref:Uncharacterized protein n=1 Tax=Passalora fulva TaxID=5499 RepID=A0A9Q8LBF9_PASFU|nr:uncharacterized protein CLAFUR5_03734 [Fulvia fulva]KAK4631888.1 hypothetical protein CLAFUR4_03749 [Fulvia fulva]KAK4633098.1 hypothetical protein CLAFUR0_03749 [Fulvia fulva]UJO14322.1 hypothetical protein CLAFUR5_03734 [Fulvia fulva]WPV10914.1 hypothetical protein CLAFUW4_03761 [Fulvia fulva]WPV26750.1 hypothetical protein CLAFUW7_03753 [Fulvia fulva]